MGSAGQDLWNKTYFSFANCPLRALADEPWELVIHLSGGAVGSGPSAAGTWTGHGGEGGAEGEKLGWGAAGVGHRALVNEGHIKVQFLAFKG